VYVQSDVDKRATKRNYSGILCCGVYHRIARVLYVSFWLTRLNNTLCRLIN